MLADMGYWTGSQVWGLGALAGPQGPDGGVSPRLWMGVCMGAQPWHGGPLVHLQN